MAAVIIELVADAGNGAFEAVLTYPGWWDCPRSGIALVGGQPYYFDCQFSVELDDYTDRYRLWPVPGDELADELEAWRVFAAWRGEYDSGLRPGPFPGVRQSAALERVRRRRRREPPPDARTAVPERRLDHDHSLPAASPRTRPAGPSWTDLVLRQRAARQMRTSRCATIW